MQRGFSRQIKRSKELKQEETQVALAKVFRPERWAKSSADEMQKLDTLSSGRQSRDGEGRAEE